MNERQWPTLNAIPSVNTSASGQAEMQTVLATLNSLIQQFNALVSTAGGLQQQIQRIVKELATIYPDGGNDNSGYLTNAILQAWPHSNFELASGGNTYLDVDLANGRTTLGAHAGELYIFGSGVWFDADYSGTTGIGKSGTNLILVAGGNDVMTFTPGGSPAVTISAAAGDLLIESGGVFFDTGTYGFTLSGTTISTGASLDVTGTVQAVGGYKAYDGTAGASVDTGGLHFKSGLFTGGTLTGGVTPGTVGDVTSMEFRVRSWNGATDSGAPDYIPIGTWIDMATLFPNIGAYPGTPWIGSSFITTLGTITVGAWHGDAIALAYIASIADQTILGNNTGGSAAPVAMNETAVRTLLGITNVENTALSTWAGTTNVVMVGTIGTGVWHGTAVAIGYGGTGATTAVAGFDALSPLTTAGDFLYYSGGHNTRLAPNTTASKKFLIEVSSVPSWSTIGYADVTDLGSWVGSTAITTLGTVATCAGFTTQGTANAAQFAGPPGMRLRTVGILPSTTEFPDVTGFITADNSDWILRCESSTKIVYPTRLVLPVI